MALMDDLRTKLIAIGNAIRSKTGGSDPLTLDGMVDAINGISTGGGGGGGGGTATPTIDGGFTVNFYNHDKELIESHSAKCGNFIDKPISYLAESWNNADGYVNSFPLTVNSAGSVVDLYAGGAGTCEQQLYGHFGIDKASYPHLTFSIDSSNTAKVTFGYAEWFRTDTSYGYNYISYMNPKITARVAYCNGVHKSGDMATDIFTVITQIGPSSLQGGNGQIQTTPDASNVVYTNYTAPSGGAVVDGNLSNTLYIPQT